MNIWMILAGLLSGVVSGMGIGGGTVLIPALTVLFGMGQREAQNVNLLYFMPTAVIALFTHIKAGNIEKSALKTTIVFGLLAAAAGACLAVAIDPSWLRRLFGAFLLFMGIAEIRKKAQPSSASVSSREKPQS